MRPHRVRVPSLALALVLGSLTATLARAATWMPLVQGGHWEYRSPGGPEHTEIIDGTVELFGRTLSKKRQIDGPDAGLVNFWQVAPDGSVLLGGFDNTSAGFSLAYDPPIVMLAAPPAAGATWTSHATVYELPSLTEYATLDIVWEVVENVELVVPAGTYQAFGVGQVQPLTGLALSSHRTLTLDGRVVTDQAKAGVVTPTQWYTEDLGVVQYLLNDLQQLVAYGTSVPAASSTWGRVKRLYR